MLDHRIYYHVQFPWVLGPRFLILGTRTKDWGLQPLNLKHVNWVNVQKIFVNNFDVTVLG